MEIRDAASLNSILEKLFTEEARQRIVANAVDEGLTSEPRHIRMAIDHLVKEGLSAGREKGKYLMRAAELAERVGEEQKTRELNERALESLEQEGFYFLA